MGLLDYLVADLERKAPELLSWPDDLSTISDPKSSACQESSDPGVVDAELSRLRNNVRNVVTDAGVDYDQAVTRAGDDDVSSNEDVLGGVAADFCRHTHKALAAAEERVREMETAASALLEYLAEPEDSRVTSLFGIIVAFRMRYNRARVQHNAGGAMKRILKVPDKAAEAPTP